MSTCDKLITKDLEARCSNPLVQGFESVGYIIRKADIKEYTMTGRIVSAITLNTGCKATRVVVKTKKPYDGSQTEMAAGDNRNTYTKTINFLVLDDGEDVADAMEALKDEAFVFINERVFKAGDEKHAFEVVGLEQGARAASQLNNPNDDATEGGWSVSETEEKCEKARIYFNAGGTDPVESSRTALEALCQ